MKVLLINPTGGPEEEYGALAKAGTELPQLGLAAIAASLEQTGVECSLIDTHVHGVDIKKLLAIIDGEQYNVVGFSVYVTTVNNALDYAKAIKDHFNHVKICFGGPQVTLSPDHFHKPYIDYVFIGEADYSFLQLLDVLKKDNQQPVIKGVLFNTGDKLDGNRELNLVENLDDLPLINLNKYYDLSLFYAPIHIRGNKPINVASSRGCPFQCTFCAAAEVNGRRIRYMSVNRFLDYIDYYVKKGNDSFMIYDDNFTLNRKRVLQISEGIINRNIQIKWNCFTRVDCVDLELLKMMKRAGCYMITFGFETMNDNTLKLLKKQFTVKQCLEAIEIVKEADMLSYSSFMFGLPGETKEDILNTIDKIVESRLDIAVFGIFEPYAGTPIYSLCIEEGSWITGEWKNLLLKDQEAVWVPKTISRKEIEELARKAFKLFFLRKNFLFNTLPKIYYHQTLKRKIRLLNSGIEYFLLSKLRKNKSYLYGSRYK